MPKKTVLKQRKDTVDSHRYLKSEGFPELIFSDTPACATSAPPTWSELRNCPGIRPALRPLPQLRPVAVWQSVRHHPRVMVMPPALEIFAADSALWQVGEHESYGHLALDGDYAVITSPSGVV